MPRDQRLLIGASRLQDLDGLLRACLLKQVQGFLQGLGGFGRAHMDEQPDLIRERRAQADAVSRILDVQPSGQVGHDRVNLNPEFGRAALDTQRQGVINVIGHAADVSRRPAGPDPAAHLRHRPAEPQGGKHVLSVICHRRLR
jgi:hypothetical protein